MTVSKERSDNRIMPFLMIQGGESKESIYAKFKNFHDMGIRSAVLQYSAPKSSTTESLTNVSAFDDIYFTTLQNMSDACRSLGMTYWVQDAAPFPTGAANGRFTEPENQSKAKVYLEERHVQLHGPQKQATLLAENFNGLLRGDFKQILDDIKTDGGLSGKGPLLGAVLMKQVENARGDLLFDSQTAVDVTSLVDSESGTITFDIPEGKWRLFFLYLTRKGGRRYYMNLLDEESVKLQIDSVHQLHYEKMQNELGVTWEGFFYDEPEVGNVGGYDFFCLPGYRPNEIPYSLPWCSRMPEYLQERLGTGWLCSLPALWYNCGTDSRVTRYHYMDVVTRLISSNYNGQVLPWCRERGIRYIGHVLEDENSHTRLGCGPGHFFRTERHQDMAGIDLIGGQILPGLDMKGNCYYGCADSDGEFYHYGLAKLASSEANINPDKHGQSFCEVNAVYGNISDAKYFKYLLDHLMINGINHLIPVITDTMTTEEGKQLFEYADRMCDLLQDVQPVIPAAILYHAESEWCGDFQYFHRPGRILAQAQIDYDVIPGDALADREFYHTCIEKGTFSINGHSYRALVIPACEYLRRDVFEILLELMDAEVPVYFVDTVPKGYCETNDTPDWKNHVPHVVDLYKLADALQQDGISQPLTAEPEPLLHYRHFIKDGRHCHMLMNADPARRIHTELSLPGQHSLAQWDTITGKLLPVNQAVNGDQIILPLSLACLECRLYVETDADTGFTAGISFGSMSSHALSANWQIRLYPDTEQEQTLHLKELTDIGLLPGCARYSDRICYQTTLSFHDELPKTLDLGEAGDSAEVWLNGTYLGLRIAAPYTYDMGDAVRNGENILDIRVTPNPARRKTTGFDLANILGAVTYATMPKAGLLGPVTIVK